ncbi:basic phospholipase A2 sphenotoxin subunit B-like isoform X2 [Phyllobates terribilis]|uniref:basic phospholipase A2 sphenotoxin subunit B-like isoform X2 n=1 Tax=Phyllobates terribilis TaxID=111132 RepID=UPI003CCA77A3
MITCLLLLLSLGSVDGIIIHLKDFRDMVKETTSKEISDALPYRCYCATTTSDQLLDRIQRCCGIRRCCYDDIRICHTGYQKYSYTYSHGTITCGNHPKDYGTHSFRIGAATEAARAGLSETEVQRIGRWRSTCLARSE